MLPLALEVLYEKLGKLGELSQIIKILSVERPERSNEVRVTYRVKLDQNITAFKSLGLMTCTTDPTGATYIFQVHFKPTFAAETDFYNEAINKLNADADIMPKFALGYCEAEVTAENPEGLVIICSYAVTVQLLYTLLTLDDEAPLAFLVLRILEDVIIGIGEATGNPVHMVTVH